MSGSPFDEKAVFNVARAIASPEGRADYLRQTCGDDPEAQRRLAELLRLYDEESSFLETPPAVVANAANQLRETPGEATPLAFLTPSGQAGSLGRLGNYEILNVVGRGGMGIVLTAGDDSLNRVVAIKVLAPELSGNLTAQAISARSPCCGRRRRSARRHDPRGSRRRKRLPLNL